VTLNAHATNGRFLVRAPWTADQAKLVQLVPEPGRNRVFFFCESCQPSYVDLTSEGTWRFGLMAFQFQDPEAPLWSGTEWPSVGEIYQSRLYMAATPSHGNRVFASRVGNPFDMRTATGPSGTTLASDAIDATLSTKGRIRWLNGRQALLAGTNRGEGSI
jgi:hypothetical protein